MQEIKVKQFGYLGTENVDLRVALDVNEIDQFGKTVRTVSSGDFIRRNYTWYNYPDFTLADGLMLSKLESLAVERTGRIHPHSIGRGENFRARPLHCVSAAPSENNKKNEGGLSMGKFQELKNKFCAA